MSSDEQSFPNYVTQTNESGAALYALVLVYTSLTVLLIVPLVIYGRRNEKRDEFFEDDIIIETAMLGQQPPRQDPPLQNIDDSNAEPMNFRRTTEVQSERGCERTRRPPVSAEEEAHSETARGMTPSQSVQGGILRQIDHFVTSSYPDDDLDFILSAISGTSRSRAQDSATPSAATTSRLYCRATQQQPRTRVWDVHGRHWKARRPIGRADTIQHAIRTETQVMVASTTSCSRNNSSQKIPPRHRDGRVPGHQNDFRRRPRSRRGSFSSAESGSILPPVEDDITPNDAADAGDPGRQSLFENGHIEEITLFCGPNALWKPQTLMKTIDVAADIANPDREMKRIVGLGIPLALGAVSDSVFQAIIVAVISNSIGTDSMAAFILVSLFLGVSDNLIGAIADAESALCSHTLSMGNMTLVGQYVQLAMGFHLIVFAAIMVLWISCMYSIVEWLVASSDIAAIALSYARISVFQHLVQTLSRTFTVLFHLVGSENFESQIDFCEGLLTVIMVACVLPLYGDATLDSVGWIQLTTAMGAFVAKLMHAATRGWTSLFWMGFLGEAYRNKNAVKQLVTTSLPLFMGAFLEYGEWELLVIFVANLGPAEVVAWTLLGFIWKILESSTEGIGEAAATRVAYHLGSGNGDSARLSSYKSCFVAVVQGLLVTSALFMISKNLVTWLTTDVTLQNMVNDVIPLVGLGNVVMNYALICWNLVGAQGRYRLATSVVLLSRWLVMVPIAAVFAYALTLDLKGMMAAVIIGFDTAGMALAYVLLRSDWLRLAQTMQDINAIVDADSEDGSESGEGACEFDASFVAGNRTKD